MLCEFDFEGICVSVQHRVKKETGKKDAAPMEETKRQKVRQDEGGKKGKIKLLWKCAEVQKCSLWGSMLSERWREDLL